MTTGYLVRLCSFGGTGVGFSVQHHHIENLPEINKPNAKRTRRFLIGDSIEGWADAVTALIKKLLHRHIKATVRLFLILDPRVQPWLRVEEKPRAHNH